MSIFEVNFAENNQGKSMYNTCCWELLRERERYAIAWCIIKTSLKYILRNTPTMFAYERKELLQELKQLKKWFDLLTHRREQLPNARGNNISVVRLQFIVATNHYSVRERYEVTLPTWDSWEMPLKYVWALIDHTIFQTGFELLRSKNRTSLISYAQEMHDIGVSIKIRMEKLIYTLLQQQSQSIPVMIRDMKAKMIIS